MAPNDDLAQLKDNLIQMVQSESSIDEIQRFLKHNISVNNEYLNQSDLRGSIYSATPLMVASRRHMIQVVRVLIAAGADVLSATDKGKIALMFALEDASSSKTITDRMETIKFLVDLMGPNVDLKDSSGKNSLLYAIEKNDLETVNQLVGHGSDVNSKDKFGICATSYAASQPESIEILEVLVLKGADLNNRDNLGRTPLFHAKSRDAIQVLCKNGANLDLVDYNGETALMKNSHDCDLVNWILEAGANIYLTDRLGRTAVELSFIKDNRFSTRVLSGQVLKLLFEYFSQNEPVKIRSDLKMFIDTQNDEYFPLKKCHLFAISMLSETGQFLDEFCFIPYFISDDFNEKLWADVINMLDENSIQIGDQLLVVKKHRAKSKFEADQLDEVAEFLNTKRNMALEFLECINIHRFEIEKFTANLNTAFK